MLYPCLMLELGYDILFFQELLFSAAATVTIEVIMYSCFLKFSLNIDSFIMFQLFLQCLLDLK